MDQTINWIIGDWKDSKSTRMVKFNKIFKQKYGQLFRSRKKVSKIYQQIKMNLWQIILIFKINSLFANSVNEMCKTFATEVISNTSLNTGCSTSNISGKKIKTYNKKSHTIKKQ